MEQPAMATKHPCEINRVIIWARRWWIVMDNDRASYCDGEIFIVGEEGGDEFWAYIES